MKKSKREKMFNIRLNDEEFDRVKRLAEHHGLSRTDLIRMIVKREFQEISRKPRLPPLIDTGELR